MFKHRTYTTTLNTIMLLNLADSFMCTLLQTSHSTAQPNESKIKRLHQEIGPLILPIYFLQHHPQANLFCFPPTSFSVLEGTDK